jgi:co-chaperonin GroES (HSP10)
MGSRVLILPKQIEEKTKSGILLGTPEQLDREQLAQTEGIVVALGLDAYSDFKSPWCKVGDKVVIAKYAGMMRTGNDEVWYRLINDTDVVAVLEEKEDKDD